MSSEKLDKHRGTVYIFILQDTLRSCLNLVLLLIGWSYPIIIELHSKPTKINYWTHTVHGALTMVKGTKLLNPADKARKEARKKELKKNKKQRQQVRSAAIESKNPEQVIADLEKLDRLEYDITTNPTFTDSLYKDRRKKLKETWTKILAFYQKEDPERHAKLKTIEAEYEKTHKKASSEFEAIKAAQEVKIEDVFLPPEPNLPSHEIADNDPLLSEDVYITPLTDGFKPPGCPPGPPPDLKLLVDSLKASMIVSLQLAQQPIPPRAKMRIDKRIATGGEDEKRPVTKNVKKQETVSKTVIESKPIIFKPKATKFVPSSVRLKKTQ